MANNNEMSITYDYNDKATKNVSADIAGIVSDVNWGRVNWGRACFCNFFARPQLHDTGEYLAIATSRTESGFKGIKSSRTYNRAA